MVLFVLDQFVNLANIQDPSLNDFDTVLGRKRRANLRFTCFNEGFAVGRFNDYGYLGPGYPEKREKDHLRIAILGDSYVESFQLFRRDQFHAIIENELSISVGKVVEVLNFGRSGFDFADMYVYQKRFVDRFKPDLIIYMISDEDLACTQKDPLIPKVVDRGGDLVITNDQISKRYLYPFQKTKTVRQNSSIVTILNNCRKLIQAGELWPKLLGKFYRERAQKQEQGLTDSVRRPVSPLALKVLAQLSANVVVVNRGTKAFDGAFMQEIDRKEIPFFRTKDTLEVLEKKGIDPYYWPVTQTRGHWNYTAHRAVGFYLSRRLDDLLRHRLERKELSSKESLPLQ
ncbi:MAG: hypothetical protein CSA95_04370 [Bacteroidetes bacterium]|nr:MAG: hypothetical protein CSA95_04370 [Bacteroidota bacterium]